MKKGNARIFKEVQFDSVEMAKETRKQYKKKMSRCKTGIKLGIIAMIIMFVLGRVVPYICYSLGIIPESLVTTIMLLCEAVGFAITIIGYIVGGGLLYSLAWIIKLGIFGWRVVPFVILDLCFGMTIGLAIGVVAFVYVPVLFLGMNYHESKLIYQSANSYLKAMGTM